MSIYIVIIYTRYKIVFPVHHCLIAFGSLEKCYIVPLLTDENNNENVISILFSRTLCDLKGTFNYKNEYTAFLFWPLVINQRCA